MPKTLRKFRRTEKKRTRYLVQEREGMDDYIYVYTDELAKRPDMHPISEEDAKAFLAELYPDLYEQVIENAEDAADVTEAPEEEIEETGASVIDDLADTVTKEEDFVKVPDPIVPKTDPKNVVGIDRDEDPECQLIESFTKKNQIEHYLLFTHGLEIEVNKDSKLADLKEEAISAIIAKRL